MKRVLLVMIVSLMLWGCQAKQTFEKVEDVYADGVTVDPQKIQLSLPEDAVLTMADGDSKLYFCHGYEILVETFPSGDLDETILNLTGFEKEMLTVMQTVTSAGTRYELVWTGASETGDMVGRAVVLDDGDYHYCLCILSTAEESGALLQTWTDIAASFSV